MIDERASLEDVAFAVCTALDRVGITAVLTGGSAATFYAPDAYQSDDIDFVITMGMTAGGGEDALSRLGFERAQDFYTHPRSDYPLDFPPGPLMVGSDAIERWATSRRRRQVLHVLTPTDSCRDRLAAFLFWNDFSGLEQALAVGRARWADIDMEAIHAWCVRERQPAKLDVFETRLRELGLR